MAYTFDNANAPSKRETQYFEMFGNRAIYHDGWIAATVPPQPPWLLGTAKMPDIMTGYKWELYTSDDFSENNDLAAKNPDKLKELQALFMDEARKYQVLPLDNSFLGRVAVPRPSAIAGRTEFTYSAEISGLPEGNTPDLSASPILLQRRGNSAEGCRRNAQHPWRAFWGLGFVPAQG
jgi:Arylsulfatase A and related enzymes